MSKQKQDLLDALDEEEKYEEERIMIPKLSFDPVRRIASVFEKANNYLDFTRLKGDFKNSLIASYLVENLPSEVVNTYLQKSRGDSLIQKIIMVDLAAGMINKYDYDVSENFKRLSIRIAGDIYHDFFSWLYESYVYDKPKRRKKEEKKTVEELVQKDFDIFLYFKGSALDSLIAASGFAECLSGMEDKLLYCESVSDIKYLLGVKTYHDMIKSSKFRKELREKLTQPGYSMKDVFVYSILKFHQDFFNHTEKQVEVKK